MATANRTRFYQRSAYGFDRGRIHAIQHSSFPRSHMPDLTPRPRLFQRVGMGQDGKVAGHLAYIVGDNYFEIVSLAVAAEYRFQRIGSELVKWLAAKLTERRALLSVQVDPKNEPAKRLFKKHGFVEAVGPPPPYAQPGKLLFILERGEIECEGA